MKTTVKPKEESLDALINPFVAEEPEVEEESITSKVLKIVGISAAIIVVIVVVLVVRRANKKAKYKGMEEHN